VGIAELVHAPAVAVSATSIGPFSGAVTGMVMTADGLMLTFSGVGIVFFGGLLAGAGINDFVVVPIIGGPTWGEIVQGYR
jgi:hypothetical protein